jgi:hypothetical protein
MQVRLCDIVVFLNHPVIQGLGNMDIDRIDEAVLALLFLGRHDGDRTWKSFDRAAMDRLHAKGLISNPVSKTKSVVFTDEGLRLSEALFQKFFSAKRQS